MANVATKAKQSAPESNRGEGFFSKLAKYLGEVLVELKKTSWPSQAELARSTAVVIAAVIIVAGWIYICDGLMSFITRRILHFY